MPDELSRAWELLRLHEREIRRLKTWREQVSAGDTIRGTVIVGTIPPAVTQPYGAVTVWENDSGAQREQGTVVIRKGDRTFDVTAVQDDDMVIGVLDEDGVADGAEGRVRHVGYQSKILTTGAVTVGHYLRPSATATRAEDAGTLPTAGAFAIAVEACGAGLNDVAAYVDTGLHQNVETIDPITLLSLVLSQSLTLTEGAEQTIAAGVITAPDAVRFPVDTQDDDPTDDLDTINGYAAGRLIVIYPADDARTIVVKHGTGNILCVNNADITLDDEHDWAWLLYDVGGANWWAR